MTDTDGDPEAPVVLAARIAGYRAPPGPAHKGLLARLGPGLITGASDDDPSGIATYSQAGAQFGYAMCWVMLFCFPLMAAIQEISARIGRVTGQGIAGNIRAHYPSSLLYAIVGLLLAANIINLGADLGAMAAALNLLVGGPVALYIVGFAIGCTWLEVYSRYERYVSILKWTRDRPQQEVHYAQPEGSARASARPSAHRRRGLPARELQAGNPGTLVPRL